MPSASPGKFKLPEQNTRIIRTSNFFEASVVYVTTDTMPSIAYSSRGRWAASAVETNELAPNTPDGMIMVKGTPAAVGAAQVMTLAAVKNRLDYAYSCDGAAQGIND